MKNFTYGDGNAIMVLVGQSMGFEPRYIEDAKRVLDGGVIEPRIGAAIEGEAVRMNNLARKDASLVATANRLAHELNVQYGFAAPPAASMQEYDVQFEDVGFTSVDLDGRELGEEEATAFTETAAKEGSLPEGVVAIVKGYITEDDAQDEDDRKVFANLTLRVRAMSDAAAESFNPPRALLARLADLMATDGDGEILMSLEGNWEVTSAELSDPPDHSHTEEPETGDAPCA